MTLQISRPTPAPGQPPHAGWAVGSPYQIFLGTVLGGGAIGGFSSTLLPPIGEPIVTTWLASTFLGALAALLFVVLISNTDRSDTLRLLAISVVAGITWQPTILGLIDANRNATLGRDNATLGRDNATLSRDIASLEETATTLQEFAGAIATVPRPEDEEEKTEYLRIVDQTLNEAVESVRTVTTEAAQTTASAILTPAFDNYRGGTELAQIDGGLDTFGASLNVRTLPDPQDVELVLTPDSRLDVEDQESTDVFIRIDISDPARYTVDVTSEEGQDLVASIHRSDEPRPMAVNDDSADSLNPRITEDFLQGEYYLHVRDFYRAPVAAFTVAMVLTNPDGN